MPSHLLLTSLALFVLLSPITADARLGSAVWHAGQIEPTVDKCLVFPPWARTGRSGYRLSSTDLTLPPRGTCYQRGAFGAEDLNAITAIPGYCPGRPGLTFADAADDSAGYAFSSSTLYPHIRLCTTPELRRQLTRTW